MAGKRFSRRERLGYWFDNRMAQGFWSKIRLLLLATALFVLACGSLAVVFRNPDESAADSFFRIAMYAIGKGGAPELGKYSGAASLVLAVLVILYCMFFTAILIGLINQALRSKVDELGKGRSRVLEEGHILILGFNDAALVMLGELIEANSNQKRPQAVVVLDEIDRVDMVDVVRRHFGRPIQHPKTRIICRTGSYYNFDDLRRCALETCRCVIVCASTDFESVKAIMACSQVLDECPTETQPYIVSVMHGEENIVESRVAARGKSAADRLVLLSLNEVLARIMVHTSRQPGLSDVFTELFNFKDDEFYIVDSDKGFPVLYGRSIAEINHYLQMSYAIGIERDGRIVIGPPHDVVFKEGDSLIVVKEDDDDLQISQQPGRSVQLSPTSARQDKRLNVLVLGAQPILAPILEEYSSYLAAGSEIHVADIGVQLDDFIDPDLLASVADAGLSIITHDMNYGNRKKLCALLDACRPDAVLVLVNQDSADFERDDELAIRALIYLREYRNEAQRYFSITSEMHLASNKELAAATEPDDFIIGRQFSALLMAQISQKREMASLFDMILSPEGFEVYMKPASWYAPLGEPVDLISVGEVAANRGEVFIGVRQKIDAKYQAADINPSKYVADMTTLRQYVFGDDDLVVVLAEDSDYAELRADRG